MILAYRLMRLIEAHSDQLATRLIEKTRNSEKTAGYLDKVSPSDLRQSVLDVYRHLGQWLLGKAEADIEQRYTEIGAQRAQQGVALAELIWAILLVKENLLEFLKQEAPPELPAEVFGELEVLQRLEPFFNRAVYYAALGYERARAAQAAAD
jgi:hypothetical protein